MYRNKKTISLILLAFQIVFSFVSVQKTWFLLFLFYEINVIPIQKRFYTLYQFSYIILSSKYEHFTHRKLGAPLLFSALIFISINALSAASTENPAYELFHITQRDGLIDASCYTVFMDSQGYIWFGTEKGLQRYDGRNFKTFKHIVEDSTAISGDFIKDIVEDPKGHLWIATDKSGLNRFDPVSETFRSYLNNPIDSNTIAADELTKLFIDQEGNLWIGLKGGFDLLLDEEKGKFKHYKPPRPELSAWDIIEDFTDSNVLWIGTRDGVLKFNRNTELYEHFPQPKLEVSYGFTGMIMQDKETIWGGGWGTGLLKFNPMSKQWTSYIDRGNNPFFRYNPERKIWRATYYEHRESATYRKNTNYPPIFVTDVFPISPNKFLIATYSQEVLRVFDTQTETFNKIHLDSSILHTNQSISGRAVYKDAYSRLWLPIFQSFWWEGVYCLEPTQLKDTTAPIRLTTITVNGQPKKWEREHQLLTTNRIESSGNYLFFRIYLFELLLS